MSEETKKQVHQFQVYLGYRHPSPTELPGNRAMKDCTLAIVAAIMHLADEVVKLTEEVAIKD